MESGLGGSTIDDGVDIVLTGQQHLGDVQKTMRVPYSKSGTSSYLTAVDLYRRPSLEEVNGVGSHWSTQNQGNILDKNPVDHLGEIEMAQLLMETWKEHGSISDDQRSQ